MKATLIIFLLSCVHLSSCSGSGSNSSEPIIVDEDNGNDNDPQYSPSSLVGFERLSGPTFGETVTFSSSTPVDGNSLKFNSVAAGSIDPVFGGIESDDTLARRDGTASEAVMGLGFNIPFPQQASATSTFEELEQEQEQEKVMDIQTLSRSMAIYDEEKLLEKFTALGEGINASLKENCNWNLLHEAVYLDLLVPARVLLRDFGFNPNAFDFEFGSAMYLIQSRAMAELLREYRGNLMDQRPCIKYGSALGSAKARKKLGVVSVVEDFTTRYGNMLTELQFAQNQGAAVQFEATRQRMFEVASGIISRRRPVPKAQISVKYIGEEGIDGGGLTREFIQMIKERILTGKKIEKSDSYVNGSTSRASWRKLKLSMGHGGGEEKSFEEGDEGISLKEKFKRVVTCDEIGRWGLVPDLNPDTCTPDAIIEHENELRLFGYIVGLSIFNNAPLNIEFQPIIYYVLCGLNPARAITDWIGMLKETDRIFYNSLRFVADLSQDERKDYSFPVIRGDSNRPWKRNKTEIKSDEDIKDFFIVSARKAVFLQYERSLSVFKYGLDLAIHSDIISAHVTPEELRRSMVGQNDYLAADWRAACRPPTHEPRYNLMFEWFWEIVDELTREQRAVLLRFATSLISLPLGGFKALNPKPSVLVIDDIGKQDKYFPKAATCSFQIRLYPASTKEILRDRLITGMVDSSNTFGDL